MDAFLAGLLIGLCVGLLVAPAVRWALTVREWRRASREAGLADEILRLMDDEDRTETPRWSSG
jgi:hypothetical protein